jgi:hypothetical protein
VTPVSVSRAPVPRVPALGPETSWSSPAAKAEKKVNLVEMKKKSKSRLYGALTNYNYFFLKKIICINWNSFKISVKTAQTSKEFLFGKIFFHLEQLFSTQKGGKV